MTNNKQQTAVEWLIEQFWNNEGMLTTKKLQKAKEIEKAQIAQAYDDGVADECIYATTGSIDFEKTGEEYYNENYDTL
jgi:hypothetical protein